GEHDDLDANFVGVQDALDVEEGEIPAKDVAETEEVKNSQSFFWEKDNGKEDHNTSPSSQNNNYTTNLNSKSPNIPCEESDSLSKPPGFEKPKYHTKHNTHHSSSSCPGVKSSRISKPVSKAFSNHGSMIEALVTQIEMGKVLGYDMQAGKCKAISKLCNKHNINFLGIQETHSSSIDSFKVKSMWGNFRFDFAFCPSVGRSGGILSIWDTNVFSKINVHPFDHFLIVEGKWVNENFQCFMVNVYAPQEDRNKVALWNSILEFKENHPGHYVVFGDFNAVRYASERIGTLFNSSSAYAFNQFIANGTLWEFPNGGHLFTRINRRGDKLSKLDRFFITEASIPHLRGHSAMVLDSHISDHRPVTLKAANVDFGPTPFKFYNSWLLDSDLCTIISDFWSLNTFYGSNAIVAFKNKLKALKRIIKEWAKNRKSAISKQKDEILLLLKKFDEDTLINDGSTSPNLQRADWIDSLHKIEREEQLNISQQAKVKWGVEADENSKISGSRGDAVIYNICTLRLLPMEWLIHVAIRGCYCAAGLYRGITMHTLSLSHFFFADDALFVGEWSRENIRNLSIILECFHRVSGLKINFHKSNLVGVGVPFDEVKALAQLTGCQASPPYFKYLGLPVGFNMAATTNWDFLIDKFSKRLSNWKASMLSIGGRTTLLSSVLGSIGTYYCSIFPMPSSIYKKLESLRSKFFWGSNVDGNKIPWIAWNTALASKVHGGLGIGSLFSLNQALILKWRWRFFQNPNALWVRVIKAVHGGPGLDNSFYSHVRDQGVWGRIAKSINAMHEKGIIPLSFLRKRVGNGTDTKFWQDVWIGEISLQSKFPRLYRLALNKECSICEVWNNGWVFNWSRPILRGTLLHQLNDLTAILDSVQFSDSEDSWIWSLGSPSFTVKCTRDHIDNCILPDDGSETIWNRYLPKKINIFLWRAVRDRLPSRWNLSRRGIELDSLTCPTCDSSVETSIHSLWLCSLAADIWNKVFAWLDLEVPPSSCIRDLFVWIGNMHVTSSKKDILNCNHVIGRG
ncbi:RNA-directed DNA polymerase, eukaryota, reverse transcriptase zinc-binding domain protein, partial [Tanacetum coccineum]